jgi:hypothetical protein
MYRRIIFAVFVLLGTAFAAHAQVSITPNLVTYTRSGAGLPKHKKTFTVRYPVVSGTKSDKIRRALNNTLNYWVAFDTTLQENLGEYHWLESLDYNVIYNKNRILTIELIAEGSGAYPDRSIKTLVVDTNSGNRIAIGDAFVRIGRLLVLIDRAQKAEVKKEVDQLNAESKGDGDALIQEIGNRKYGTHSMNEFIVDDRGVTFLYDYGFPHAIQALEPEGRYFFSWKQIKPFVRHDGLLGSFVR